MPRPDSATLTEFRSAIDAYVAARKTLAGVHGVDSWQPGREAGEMRLKLPLEVAGELRGHLCIDCTPSRRPIEFSIGLIYPPAVSRLDFPHAHALHGNNLAIASDNVPPLVMGPHYHPWHLNRRFATSITDYWKLQIAEPVSMRKFDAALRWFCDQNNIELPGQHGIELPSAETLF
jgi:hypothetical protein